MLIETIKNHPRRWSEETLKMAVPSWSRRVDARNTCTGCRVSADQLPMDLSLWYCGPPRPSRTFLPFSRYSRRRLPQSASTIPNRRPLAMRRRLKLDVQKWRRQEIRPKMKHELRNIHNDKLKINSTYIIHCIIAAVWKPLFLSKQSFATYTWKAKIPAKIAARFVSNI